MLRDPHSVVTKNGLVLCEFHPIVMESEMVLCERHPAVPPEDEAMTFSRNRNSVRKELRVIHTGTDR